MLNEVATLHQQPKSVDRTILDRVRGHLSQVGHSNLVLSCMFDPQYVRVLVIEINTTRLNVTHLGKFSVYDFDGEPYAITGLLDGSDKPRIRLLPEFKSKERMRCLLDTCINHDLFEQPNQPNPGHDADWLTALMEFENVRTH